MARRHYTQTRTTRTSKVTKIKVPKVPKPRVKELKLIYKNLITASDAQRVDTLAYALAWWDKAVSYALSQNLIVGDLQSKLDKAIKARKHGLGSPTTIEREAAFRAALLMYEKTVPSLDAPVCGEVYKLYESKKADLTLKVSSLNDKYDDVIDILSLTLAPMDADNQPITIAIVPKIVDVATGNELSRKFNHSLNRIEYSRKQARDLHIRIRREGVLAVVIQECFFLSRMTALMDGDNPGTYKINAEQWIKNTYKMLGNFVGYAQGDAPKKLVRRRKPGVAEPGADGSVRVVRRVSSENRVGGEFRDPDSPRARMYVLLEDGQLHEKAELQKSFTTSVDIVLEKLNRRGKLHSKWEVISEGSKVRMQLSGVAQVQP